jgi:hypothetical protein
MPVADHRSTTRRRGTAVRGYLRKVAHRPGRGGKLAPKYGSRTLWPDTAGSERVSRRLGHLARFDRFPGAGQRAQHDRAVAGSLAADALARGIRRGAMLVVFEFDVYCPQEP